MSQKPKSVVIDLVFNPTCPYLDEARKLLDQLKNDIAHPLTIREWDVSKDETPEELKKYPLPAFVVNGTFLNPEIEGSCRCHRPHKKLISYDALRLSVVQIIRGKNRWYLALASIPTVLLSLIPFAGCPCSLVALTAFLSALGLSWVDNYILPLFITFLSITLLCLYIMAQKSGRLSFFIFGLISSAVLFLGKWYEIDIMVHLGIGGLVGASLFSAIYKKRIKKKKPL